MVGYHTCLTKMNNNIKIAESCNDNSNSGKYLTINNKNNIINTCKLQDTALL